MAATHTTGASREPPLSPPPPLFFHADSDTASPEPSNPPTPDTTPSTPLPQHDAPSNPFGTPPPPQQQQRQATPTSHPAHPPFSAPRSVLSFSSSVADAAPPPTREFARQPPTRPGTAYSSAGDVGGAEQGGTRPGTGTSQRVRESFAAPPKRAAPSRHASLRRGPAQRERTGKVRAVSTALAGEIAKPWLLRPDAHTRLSWWITMAVLLFGVAASAVRIFFGMRDVPLVKGKLCLVMEDNFDKPELDTAIWQHEVDLGGFGNGEFEMATDSPNNTFVRDGVLYIAPTLTRDVIGSAAIFDGHTFNLTGCTNANTSACGAISNATTRAVINPVQSARLTTRKSTNIQFGRVEVRARMPRGDWLWPAVWMLPVDNAYGAWPISGEIDIVEARGNGFEYARQGRNFVRASLNWGPLTWINKVATTFGFWYDRRVGYDEGFHTYALEWTPEFLRIYVDTRLNHIYTLSFNEPFFTRGNFPPTVFNGSQEIALTNPWAVSGTNAAPFDKPFYLIMNLAVGGTSGWFPDGVGDKPWLDGSSTAMYDFATKTDEWYATWPQDVTRRALAVDYVKMWQQC